MSKSTRSRKSSTRAEAAAPPPGSGAPAGAAGILDVALAVAAAAAVAVGVWARFHGLGRWPVSYDEFLTGSSVRAILRDGVPTLGESGLYVRGILVQYLQAGVRLLGFGEEFSLRAVSALAGAGTLPAVYLLSGKVSGRPAALLATAAAALSAWEIEFSRFGRAYAVFQCLFLWFAWFLYCGVVERDRKGWRRAWLLALVAIPVHETAPFLFLLLLFTTAALRKPLSAKDAALALAGFALAILFNAVDFRNLGAVAGIGRLAAGSVGGPAKGALLAPPVFWALVPDNPLLAIPALLLLAFGAFAAVKALSDRGAPLPERIALVAAVAAGALNLFGAALLLVLAALLAGPGEGGKPRRIPRATPCHCAVALGFAFWTAVLLSAPRGGNLLPDGIVPRIALLFSWPDVWGRVFSLWFGVLPAFCAMGAALLAWWLFDLRRGREETSREGGRLVGLLVLGTVALLAVSRTPWLSTRYSFAIYPLLLIVLLDAMRRVADVATRNETRNRIVLGILFLAFLLFSEDARADRLFRVDSARVNFRLPYILPEMHHYVPRFDYRTPAESVEAGRKPEDVVVTCVLPPNFYLLRPSDYHFLPRQDPEYRGLVDARGRLRWTGAAVLDREGDLLALLDDRSRNVWLIAGSGSFPFGGEVARLLAERYRSAEHRRGVDGAIVAYRLPAGRPQEPPGKDFP